MRHPNDTVRCRLIEDRQTTIARAWSERFGARRLWSNPLNDLDWSVPLTINRAGRVVWVLCFAQDLPMKLRSVMVPVVGALVLSVAVGCSSSGGFNSSTSNRTSVVP